MNRLVRVWRFAPVVWLWGKAAEVHPGPQSPCKNIVSPAYPELEQSAMAKVWEHGELGRTRRPPRCTGWEETGFSTLVVAARFHYTGGHDDLLSRIGAISRYKGVKYWSTTHQQADSDRRWLSRQRSPAISDGKISRRRNLLWGR